MTELENDDDFPLAGEFPPATYEQWRKVAEAALGGARLEERLQHRTADGLPLAPLYSRFDADSRTSRGAGTRWQVLQRIDHPDAATARAQALEDLQGGADGLVLVGAGAVGAHGFGLPEAPETVEFVLDQVEFTSCSIDLEIGVQSEELPRRLAALIRKRGTEMGKLDIRFGIDPLGIALIQGGFPAHWNEVERRTSRRVEELVAFGYLRSILVADGRVIYDAGGTEAQELAYVIAAAVGLLRMLEAAGIAPEFARRLIYFRLAADTDQFLTIVKFRALRQLWRHVQSSCALDPQPAFIAAETGWRTMTRNAPAMNIVRATLATFSAGVGGADAMIVMPFTAANGLPDAFARRVARNTQLVLLQEANVANVTDPSAGTGWVEALTSKLCRKSWSLFQEIEACGGASTAIERNFLQAKVAEARTSREHAIATCNDVLVGSNEFAHLGELSPGVLDVQMHEPTPTMPAVAFTPLSPMRLAVPYEELREKSDQRLAATGIRPTVLLVSLGPPGESSARLEFGRNFFACGGVAAIESSAAELPSGLQKGITTAVCLCGTDERLIHDGPRIARHISAVGTNLIFATTEPQPLLRAANVSRFVYNGCDALSLLRELHSH